MFDPNVVDGDPLSLGEAGRENIFILSNCPWHF